MSPSLHGKVSIFLSLFGRYLYVARTGFLENLLNCGIFICLQAFIFSYILPTIGFSSDHAGLMFIGIMLQVVLFTAYTRSLAYVSDIKFGKLINFEQTLPFPLTGVLAVYFVSFAVELACYLVSLFCAGSLVMGSALSFAQVNWPLLVAHGAATLFFSASFMLFLSFRLSFNWHMDHIWPRLLSPMMLLGCAWFSWIDLYRKFPIVAKVLLVNPAVHITEGTRYAFLGTATLRPVVTIGSLLAWGCICLVFVGFSVNKKLDPVRS